MEIQVNMLFPDFNRRGEILISKGELWREDGNDLVILEEFTNESTIRCSYDPNDKQVSPVGRSQEALSLIHISEPTRPY